MSKKDQATDYLFVVDCGTGELALVQLRSTLTGPILKKHYEYQNDCTVIHYEALQEVPYFKVTSSINLTPL